MGCLSEITEGIAKYLLFLFNFLIVVCGIILIAVGALILVNEGKGIAAFTEYSVGGFAVAVGVIIFLIAFFGCCGAIKEDSCMLTTYAVILVTLFILQAVLGALAFVALRDNNGEIDRTVQRAVQKVFDGYVNDPNNQSKKNVVDNIQKSFKCCGVTGYEYWSSTGLGVPDSCCNGPCFSIESYYGTGCTQGFINTVTSHIKVVGGVAIAFAVVELLGAVFACIVKNNIS